MISGTIIGEIRIAMIARRNGISGRDRPRAASVPRTVATMVEHTPMMIEFLAACTHFAFAQASDQKAQPVESGFCIPKVSRLEYHRML